MACFKAIATSLQLAIDTENDAASQGAAARMTTARRLFRAGATDEFASALCDMRL